MDTKKKTTKLVKMFKKIRSVSKIKKKTDKKLKFHGETIPENDLKRSKSDIDLAQSVQAEQNAQSKSFAFKYRSKSVRAHRRTKSNEQWSQTDFENVVDQTDAVPKSLIRRKPDEKSTDQLEVTESPSGSRSQSENRQIEINKKKSEIEIPTNTSLHPAYICSLLVLVGFNFAAFTSFYYSSSIFLHQMILALLAGILVAVFLRRFIGLNLFKTKDKVSERSVLTLVTQIRLVYKFVTTDYQTDLDEFVWSFFLFNLSIWILFLDKISFNAVQTVASNTKATISEKIFKS